MKNVIEYLEERSFVEQMSSDELKKIVQKPIHFYIGFDPTADSLHLGNLVGIIAAKHFQNFGHKPVILIGGATGRIGDPSGKSLERPLLSDEILEKNVQSIRSFFEEILDFSDPKTKPIILNNNDWFSGISFIDFLRDVGKQFRVGPMLAKESIKTRIASDEGMSFTEFSYLTLQAYDFCHLEENQDVMLQVGGSDQWGNITAGIELVRKLKSKSVYGLTFPLLTRSDGKKFGKSEEGAIWLSNHKLSPYKFYQYLIRLPDADVIKLFRMLTFLELDEIQKIENEMQSEGYVPNTAQRRLAEEVTRFVHKEEGLKTALKVTDAAKPGSGGELSLSALIEIAKDMPNVEMGLNDILGKKFTEVASLSGLVSSKSEAVRLVKNGGAYLNNARVTDPGMSLTDADIIENSFLMLGAGKKKKILVRIT